MSTKFKILICDDLLNSDKRDVLVCLLHLVGAKKIRSSEVFVTLSDYFIIEYRALFNFFGFEVVHEKFKSYDFILDNNYLIKHIDSLLFFRKASELDKTSAFKSNKNSLIVYLSGFIKESTYKRLNSFVLVGPKWKFSSNDQVIISGVNFVKLLLQRKQVTNKLLYRGVSIGSSSLNKNIILSYFILLFTRSFQYIRCKSILPDIIYIKKYNQSYSGLLIHCIFKIIKYINDILKIKIVINLGIEPINHNTITHGISHSQFILIPYFKEGFPRVIGESLFFNKPFFTFNFLRMGDHAFKNFNFRFTFLKLISTIIDESFVPYTKMRDILLYNEAAVQSKISQLGYSKFTTSLDYVNNNKYLIFYFLLTNDLSWFDDDRKV